MKYDTVFCNQRDSASNCVLTGSRAEGTRSPLTQWGFVGLTDFQGSACFSGTVT